MQLSEHFKKKNMDFLLQWLAVDLVICVIKGEKTKAWKNEIDLVLHVWKQEFEPMITVLFVQVQMLSQILTRKSNYDYSGERKNIDVTINHIKVAKLVTLLSLSSQMRHF